jgi:hypothetical protein
METEKTKTKTSKMKNWQVMSAAPPHDASASQPSMERTVLGNFWKLVEDRGEDYEILCHGERVT